MKVIAVLNQKGGAGKTTIATHLARAFQLLGKKVLLVDSDTQGSARDWAAANENQPVTTIGIDRTNVAQTLKGLSVDIAIIDGAPQAHEMAVAAIKAADLVIVPVQPSPYDLWACSDLVDLIKTRIEITNGKLKAAFVVSRAITGTKIGREVTDALDGYGLPVLSRHVHQRVIYATSAATGSTAMDADHDSDAAREIRLLTTEIEAMLNS